MLSICFIFFILFLILSISLFVMSMNFMILDYNLILEYELVSLNSSSLIMTVLLDWMSLLFMSFVLFISSMVINYSDEYMHGDLNVKRFILLVVMFVLSMMFLIISPNLISILLGWDGLGLVSYCLVIYYQNVKSFNAGMITALTNRIGDVALLMSIAWMMNYGSWNYIFYLELMKNDFYMEFISYMVLLAAMTKSAQIPFSSWLPAAMAAPTPVSSLVHSSTLVTAGVYLLIRFYPALNSSVLFFLLLIGSMTMFMAGLGANFEFDLKKIIALSTLSQLGLMMSILALGELNLTLFHLLTHALFKATLFMCAGCMIHSMNNNQDIRYMGSMIISMPLTCCFFNISNLALCGLPFLSGFYSKDLIIEVLSMNYLNIYIYLIYFLSTGLTACYTFRLFYYSMFGSMNFYSLNMISDSSYTMLKSMGGLIFFVIMGGSMLMWMILVVPYMIILPFFMKLMALLVTLTGFMLGLEISKFYLNYSLKSLKFLNSSLFFSSMWNMPILSTFMVNKNTLFLSGLYYKSVDQGWSEYYGSQNIFNNLKNYSMFLQLLYKNNLKVYMIILVIWVIFIFLI